MTSVLFNVSIINSDAVIENNETFKLMILNSSIRNQGFIFTVRALNEATVTIIDTTSE